MDKICLKRALVVIGLIIIILICGFLPESFTAKIKEIFSSIKPEIVQDITDTELQTISENLFKNDVNNAGKYVMVNYQGKAQSNSQVDFADQPLLNVNMDVWNMPTIKAIKPLYDNYEKNTKFEETVTSEELLEEVTFLDAVMSTPLMIFLLSVLKEKGLVPKEYTEQRDFLKSMWFELYPRNKGKLTSSGFEHIFLSEIKNGQISGLHNWLYFMTQEETKNANYLGYFKKVDLNEDNSIVKLTFTLDGIKKPISSMFVASSPELEMGLYTLCFLARPNKPCRLTMGGHPFTIKAYTFKHNGKNLIGSAFPEI